MLTHLEIQNFKQHQSYSTDFTSGLNVIKGDNGAGKTSLLKAILYGLFGASAVGAKDHLTSWDGGKMQVSLSLNLRNVPYVITRSFNKAEVRDQGNNLMASGHSPCTKFIEDHLGMDSKTLRTLLCVEQGEAQGLLKMGAAGLQKSIEQVAQVDLLDKVLSFLLADVSANKARLDVLTSQADFEDLIPEIKQVQEAVVGLEKSVKATEHHIDYTQVKLSECQEKYRKAWDNKLQREALQIQITSTQESINQLNHQEHKDQAWLNTLTEETLQDCLEQEYKMQYIGNKQIQLRNQITELNREIGQRIYLEKGLESANKELEGLRPKEEHSKRYLEARSRKEALLSGKKALADERDLLQRALRASVCPTCNREYADKDAGAIKAQLDGVEVKQSELEDQLKQVQDLMVKIEREAGILQATLINWDNRVQSWEQEVAKAQAQLEDLPEANSEQLKILESELVFFQNRSRDLDQLFYDYNTKVDRLEVLRNKLKSETAKLMQAELQLSEIPEVEDVEALQAQAKSQNEELRNLQQELNQHTRALLEEQAKLKRLEDRKAFQDQRKKEIDEVQTQLNQFLDLQKFLRANRGKYLQNSWDSLIRYSSYLMEATTEGLLTQLSRDESGTFFVQENSRVVPVSELSGARKSIVSICIRIALAKVFFGDHGFTLMDEITADCTDENAARVAGLLQSLKSQTILVTHRTGDLVNASTVIAL